MSSSISMVSSQQQNDKSKQSDTLLAAIPVLKSSYSDLELKGQDCKAESSSFWEFFLYVPILLQSVFGTLYFIRSLALGHAIHQLFQRLENWIGPQAWPPPSFVFLAGLTIVALVVHPDGLTWILLRYLRQGIMSVLQAAFSCWQMVLNEHGAIISTCLALATFAGLFFLVFVLHKTLAPRQPPNLPSSKPQNQRPKSLSANKKKKRKGGHGRGRTGKARLSAPQPKQNDPSTDCVTAELAEASRRGSEERKESPTPEQALPAVLEDLPVKSPPQPMETPTERQEEDAMDRSLPVSTHSSNPVCRDRTMSTSTIDSIATVTSGDHSCGSTSGRSTPTLAVPPQAPESTSKSLPGSRQPPRSSHRKNSNRRRGGRKSDNRTANANRPSNMTTSSRWDALKPSNRTEHRRTHVLQSPPRINSATRNHHHNTSSRVVPSPEETSLSSSSTGANSMTPLIPLDKAPGPNPTMKSTSPISTNILPLAESDSLFSRNNVQPPTREFPGTAQLHNPVLPISSSPLAVGSPTFGYTNPSCSPPPPASLLGLPPVASSSATNPNANWMLPANIPAPPGLTHPLSPPSSPFPVGIASSSQPTFGGYSGRGESRVKANPFASDEEDQLVPNHSGDGWNGVHDEDQIEAELQELGGRMVGSILDF